MRRLILILVLKLLLQPSLQAQPTLVLPGALSSGEMDISPYTFFYKDLSGDPLSYAEIRNKTFRPFSEKPNERNNVSDQSRAITWIRFSIKNTHPTDTLKLYHEVWAHNDITTYENGKPINRVGLSINAGISKGSFPRRPLNFETKLIIPPGQQNTYYVRVIDYVLTVTPIISKLTSVESNPLNNYEIVVATLPLMTIMCIFLGCLVFMHLYALYSYSLTRDKAYLYYVIYTFIAGILSFHSIDIRFGLGWLYPHYPIFSTYYPGPVHPALLTIFYGLFIGQILDLKEQFPRIWRVIRILFVLLVLQQVMAMVESYLGRPLFINNTLYEYGLLPSIFTSLLLVVAVYRSRSLLRMYLLAGMLGLLCFGSMPILFNFNIQHLPPTLDSVINYIPIWIQLGLLIESLCFAMALAYRSRLTELENYRMHQQYANELEATLAERTREIEEKGHQLEEQRVHQLERAFDQRLAETEMGALRAQMNPHFIFNCLNSIKLYATENESGKAAEYLTKFSRLIRLVLENSRSEKVSLQKELEALRLYLEMEAMRFKDKLKFMIEVNGDIDTDFIEIPPLLIQPFVENAIWHGIMHKDTGGTVSLRVEQSADNLLRVTIIDDGIGRAKAALLKSKSATPQKSFGMAVTSERIALINQLYQTETRVQIHDLVNELGEAAGTEIVLEVPI